MTKSEAITAIYTLFNAPHNADINIVYLNKVLDDLCKSHPEQEEWPEEPVGHMAGGVRPPQRTWVGLTDEEVESLQRLAIDPVDANGWGFLNRERFAYLIEIKLKEKNNG